MSLDDSKSEIEQIKDVMDEHRAKSADFVRDLKPMDVAEHEAVSSEPTTSEKNEDDADTKMQGFYLLLLIASIVLCLCIIATMIFHFVELTQHLADRMFH